MLADKYRDLNKQHKSSEEELQKLRGEKAQSPRGDNSDLVAQQKAEIHSLKTLLNSLEAQVTFVLSLV